MMSIGEHDGFAGNSLIDAFVALFFRRRTFVWGFSAFHRNIGSRHTRTKGKKHERVMTFCDDSFAPSLKRIRNLREIFILLNEFHGSNFLMKRLFVFYIFGQSPFSYYVFSFRTNKEKIKAYCTSNDMKNLQYVCILIT